MKTVNKKLINKEHFAIKVLTNLNVIDSQIRSFSRRVETYALATHCCYEDSVDTPVQSQIEKIFQLSKRSSLLSQLRNAVVDAANNLEKSQRLLLVLTYVKKTEKNKILKHFSISLRTYYRHLHLAHKHFEHQLLLLGYTQAWFDELCREIKHC